MHSRRSGARVSVFSGLNAVMRKPSIARLHNVFCGKVVYVKKSGIVVGILGWVRTLLVYDKQNMFIQKLTHQLRQR